MLSQIFVFLLLVIGGALAQSIVSPFNGTYYESGDSIPTVIQGLRGGQKYRLAFYPTDTGNILWSMNFTSYGSCSEVYYAYVPLEFSGNGTIQLYNYKDKSVPAFVSLNILKRQ